jgi:hypothetical protein
VIPVCAANAIQIRARNLKGAKHFMAGLLSSL